MTSRLNTTDFAILGLLARRPWSAYEMTQYMRASNIRAIWPRAESRIYESPKKLASLGFAAVTTEAQGKRSRAVYRITANGQAALDDWLAEEGKPFLFEYEELLKLNLGDIRDPDHLSIHLERLGRQGQADWNQLADWFRLFAQQEASDISADRRAQNLLINCFIKELLEARLRWSEYASEFEQKFAACDTDDAKEEWVARCYRELLGEE